MNTIIISIITPDKNWLSFDVAPLATFTVVLNKVLEQGRPPSIPHTILEIERPNTSYD